MNERALIISFGTRDIDAQGEIRQLEDRLARIAAIPVSSACLHSDYGTSLDRIIAEHRSEMFRLMPLLVQKGGEYNKILSYGFMTGAPLLGNKEDAAAVASILNAALPFVHDSTYILLAHGDERNDIEEYRTLRDLLRKDMILTTLKGPENYLSISIPDTSSVILMPFLLLSGHHVKKDIKEKAVPYFENHGKNTKLFAKGLLSLSESFTELIMQHFQELLSRPTPFGQG